MKKENLKEKFNDKTKGFANKAKRFIATGVVAAMVATGTAGCSPEAKEAKTKQEQLAQANEYLAQAEEIIETYLSEHFCYKFITSTYKEGSDCNQRVVENLISGNQILSKITGGQPHGSYELETHLYKDPENTVKGFIIDSLPENSPFENKTGNIEPTIANYYEMNDGRDVNLDVLMRNYENFQLEPSDSGNKVKFVATRKPSDNEILANPEANRIEVNYWRENGKDILFISIYENGEIYSCWFRPETQFNFDKELSKFNTTHRNNSLQAEQPQQGRE